MGRHVFMVMTNPVEGREDEYNEWYSGIHLQEVVAIAGFISAQRFKLSDAQLAGDSEYRYRGHLRAPAAKDVATCRSRRCATHGPTCQMSDAASPRRRGAWAYSPHH